MGQTAPDHTQTLKFQIDVEMKLPDAQSRVLLGRSPHHNVSDG